GRCGSSSSRSPGGSTRRSAAARGARSSAPTRSETDISTRGGVPRHAPPRPGRGPRASAAPGSAALANSSTNTQWTRPTMSNAQSAPGRRTLSAFSGLLLLAAGCADDGIPPRYPVSGTVTYKGQPLASGSINFIPESESGRGATGTIIDGRYSLTTHAP